MSILFILDDIIIREKYTGSGHDINIIYIHDKSNSQAVCIQLIQNIF